MNIYLYINIIIVVVSFICYFYKVVIKKSPYLTNSLEIERKDTTNNYIFLSVCFVIIVFITGFRGNFSPDYGSYEYIFHGYNLYSFKEILFSNLISEKAYAILNKAVGLFSKDVVALMTTVAIITVFCYFKEFKKYSKYIWLSILLLLCVGSYYTIFNTMRQSLVAAMTFVCAKYIYERKLWKYIISILIVSMFHISTLIMIPFYFILNIKFTKKNAPLLAIVALVGFILMYFNTNFIIDLARRTFYDSYTETSYGISYGTVITTILRPMLIFIFVLLHVRFIDLKDIKERVWFNSSICFLVCAILSTKVLMLQRFTYFFLPYVSLLIPQIISKLKTKKLRIVYCILIIVLVMSYSYLSNINSVYYFFWER
ncbi:EpsG family protein [Clostridium estertheticum]|uniref:EpsG family protein n=1 Tax=Clostridium estertheticum TaxID=238834 RepID=UPI001C0DF9A4|nr:EpsG family protein [Clostridium estertheticum]MBU3178170.1 EpsG family protein [Clostridium estertheticum]